MENEEDDMKAIESISFTIVNFLNNFSKESGLMKYFLILIDDVHVNNAVNDSQTTLSGMVSKTILLLSEVKTLKFIITTTNPMLIDDFSEDCKEVIFEGMHPLECISFLKGSPHFIEETNEDIENLLKNIGCLPITINSASKFMVKYNMHIKENIELYEKAKKDADNESINKVVNCQTMPLECIMNGIDGSSWEVITLLPYLDYASINLELVKACCYHVCKDETKAEIIIFRFLNYSLCQYLKRLRVFTTEGSQEDIIFSFHSETMRALKLIEKNTPTKKTTDRHKLFVLLKMFCFEIDFDARINSTLERNLMFLNHARCVLRLFEEGGYDQNENEKVYMSYINYLIGKTILYQGTDIPLAHKHLMKSQKLCLEFVEEDSDLTSRKCPYLATKVNTNTEEVPIMKSEKASNIYKSLSSKTLDHNFVKQFVLSKRRDKRDVYLLQHESRYPKMCKSNYLSEQEYIYLTTCKPKLAMPLESICKSFLSELMLNILHDNGRALDELMLGAEHNEQVKIACAFEVGTYKELKSEKEFKDFPLLLYLAIERNEQDIHVQQCTLDNMKFNIDNLERSLQNESDYYFQFGVVKTIFHRCSLTDLLLNA
ncbi:unnamed protein product [Mytilus coruscus]|uniref:Uncharacterized protein n=1 Tax=Mytilus coruscus TaxID=42192 RepID=A0A6J8C7V3_MYTCO|nr:unnamed protein product [Mytilus coruscus]